MLIAVTGMQREARLLRGRYRFRLMAKAKRGFDLSAYLRAWLAAVPKPKGNIRLEVDIDPQSFL